LARTKRAWEVPSLRARWGQESGRPFVMLKPAAMLPASRRRRARRARGR
jgi:hypothetical protein